MVNIVTVEPVRAQVKSRRDNDVDVMPVGKRTPDEREGRGASGSKKKKGKAKEGDDAKTSKKRAPRRWFEVTDFPLGVGQSSYSLKEDMIGRKANITFAQLIEMVPWMKRQWKGLVNPTERERHKGSVRALNIQELPDICLIVEAGIKGDL